MQIIVATGFVAKNPQGQVTTLKRNGSDYSATIIGALLRGAHITIWTDVDGVFSADPRKVTPPGSAAIRLEHCSKTCRRCHLAQLYRCKCGAAARPNALESSSLCPPCVSDFSMERGELMRRWRRLCA